MGEERERERANERRAFDLASTSLSRLVRDEVV